jgi:lysophospholipase L1-like esterase
MQRRPPTPTQARRSLPYVLLLIGTLLLIALFPAVSPLWSAAAVACLSVLIVRHRRQSRKPPGDSGTLARFAPYALLILVAAGLGALRAEVGPALMAPVIAIAIMLGVARWRVGNPYVVGAILFVGALLVPLFALLGFDALWALVPFLPRPLPYPLVSFLLGAALLGVAAWLYLRPWWVRKESGHPYWAAAGAVALLVAAQPVAALIIANGKKGTPLDELRPAAVSQLDVIVLRDGSDTAKLGRVVATRGWKVTNWVGQVSGDHVTWGEAGEPPRQPRADADRVVMLAVDGAPGRLNTTQSLPLARREAGEIDRWMRLADEFTQRDTPTFAVLQSTEEAPAGARRLADWRHRLTPAGEEPDGRRHGGVLSLQQLDGDRSLTDVALRYAVLSPTTDQDLALAAKHRPALFFDSGEPFPTPLNIDRLLASGKIKLCAKSQALSSLCPTVTTSADLHNDGGHLAFDLKDLAGVDKESTIYVNVTRSGNDQPKSVYLDYWWFFPHNPTGAGRGALCGVGFVLAGATCFDHQSDWEGVTVVLDESKEPPVATAVLYAQHDGTTRYPWATLQRLWHEGRDGGDVERVRRRFGQKIDTDLHPLVFAARGTHASYPKSCASEACHVAGVQLNEKSHDGKKTWAGNDTRRCQSICVAALPTRRGGNGRALWNAFDGPWGAVNCFAVVLCTSSDPPLAPGAQARYRVPWCARTTVVTINGHDRHYTRPKDEDCPARKPPLAAGTDAAGLLALGDSFSSGQGAGHFDPATTGHGNTCFRSPDAWPQVLAPKLRLTALPSLACSGATAPEVLRDRAGGQVERRRSQVGRIGGSPKVITITIGGNDVGFAKVLRDCVSVDCKRKYDKPSGDVLARRVDDLARDTLPPLYRAIRAAAPGARLLVVGYPRLFPKDVPDHATPNCAAWGLITSEEVGYLNRRTETLNAGIRQAARSVDVEFVDVEDAFDGHELRCSGMTYMNRLKPLSRLRPSSFHPNAAGHARLAEVVAARVS